MLHFTTQWLLSLETLEEHFVCTLFKRSSFTLWWRHFPSAHTKVKDHNTLYTSGFNLCNIGRRSWNHNGLHYLSFRFTTLIWTLSSQHFKDHIRRRTSCPRWLLCVLLIFAAWRYNCILATPGSHRSSVQIHGWSSLISSSPIWQKQTISDVM